MARLKQRRAKKGSKLGLDGVVTKDAAYSRYRRALKRGTDINGNAVPAGIKGEDKIKWHKMLKELHELRLY